MKILAVDDNPDNLTVLKAVLLDRLPEAGLVTALDGPKGLELAESEDPDVILLDIVMPGMDGYDVCQKLKADEVMKSIPVLFLTAHTDRDSRIKAVEAGADGFLSKPIDELELTVQILAMTKLKAANRLQRLEKEELIALVAERTRELERELAERKHDAEINAFLATVRGSEINTSFFYTLAGFLAGNLQMDFVCIDVLEGDGLMARTLAVWHDGRFEDNVTYALKDTPCGDVVGKEVCCFPANVCQFFPRDQVLQDLRAESYIGVTLFDHTGKPIGLIALISRNPLADRALAEATLSRVSQVAAIELERLNAEAVLREATLLLQQTSRIAKIGGWQLDLQSNNVAWTQETYRIHEVAQDYQPKLGDGLSFYPQESRPAIEEAVKRAIEKGERFDLEVPFITAKGNRLWVKSSGEPQYEGGRCVRISGTFQDITERKQSEESLQILQTAVEQSANMVEVTDPMGNIEYVNPAFEKGTGYSSAEAVGRNPRILKSGRQDAGFYRNLWATITAGNIWRGEFHNRRKDGSFYWESATISPVQNDRGEIVHFIAIKEDITERKAMETRLTGALHRAEEGSRTKSEFLAIMSHELRTPLNGVLGFAQLLSDTPLDSDQQAYAKTISRSGEHLLAIVGDILDFSSIEAGTLAIHVAPQAVADLVKTAEDTVRKTAAEKGLELRCELAAGVPEQITGDEQRIRQILLNLLGNAVKFTASGSVVLRVAPDAAGRFLDFSVEDTGIGISSETLERLFQPFVQADSKMNRRFGGTGLGLAISKRIAEAMGGAITVASTPGKGSTFTFHFPLEISSSKIGSGILRSGLLPLCQEEPSSVTPLPHALVLVVDDDNASGVVAVKMLQNLGCNAEFVTDGAKAVEAFVPGKYSVILMDVSMPVMDGLVATKKIRKIEAATEFHVPIIAFTANVMPGDRERCLAAGMDDFLAKPFKRAELAAKLAGVAQR